MHLAGASAIQIGTALISGIDVFQRIKEGVQKYLRDEDFADISEIVGAARRD
jgi:dihydroorotate dehydrogenase (NAD+) catalytic subunit